MFTTTGVEDMYYENPECIINDLEYISDLSIPRKWENVIECIYIDEDDYDD